MKKILHLSTGGTITGCEADYPAISKLSHFFSDPIDIEKYLNESLRMVATYSRREICNKDSRGITEQDRAVLKIEIERAFEEGIHDFLITHGTYTMPETGIYLMENLSEDCLNNISVVLTGAMYPMNLVGGDGLLNLGASVSMLINSESPFGIKINMHGKNWDPKLIEKDADSLIFKMK